MPDFIPAILIGPLLFLSSLTIAPVELPVMSPTVRPVSEIEAPLSRWGRDGHRIVCEIAYQESSEKARALVDYLLGLDADYDSFPESCLWADAIRRTSEYNKFRTAHYMNLPKGATSVRDSEHCAVSFCVPEGIEEQQRVLANPRYNDRARLDALKFVVHFIGDIHQPLHAGYDFDRGGNSATVQVNGETRNLHGVWDYSLIEMTGMPWQAYADSLEAAISASDRRAWINFDPMEWAAESYEIVVNSVYDVPEDRVISEAYYARNIGTVEKRLKQAGIRLAASLDKIVREYDTAMVLFNKEQVSGVLDALHVAAAEADFDGYFSLYTDDAVFLGTDATERWPVEDFKEYTRARFGGGTGWTYYMSERHIVISEDGRTAWFDESLDNVNMGATRGTGVLVKTGSEWKIAQYNLTVPIPNDLAREFVATIRKHAGAEGHN